MNFNPGIILQARTGSSRFPKKIIKPFYKEISILEILIQAYLRNIGSNIPLVIATSNNLQDDVIEDLAKRYNISSFRGSEENVLNRFIDAADYFGFNTIIRACSDNPFFDFKGSLELLNDENLKELDYLGFRMENKLPTILSHLGFWGEVVQLDALKKAHNSTTKLSFREHVTNYIYQNPKKFRIKLMDAPDNLGKRNDIRLTVDTKADFDLIQDIYTKFMQQNLTMNPVDVVNFIDKNPEYLKKMKRQIELNKK